MTTLLQEVNTVDEVPEGWKVLAIMDRSGDSKHIWNPNDPEEVKTMRELFNSEKKKGRTAYTVNRQGEKGEIVKDFDPAIDKIIFAPALVGG
jgi:hypothetical protein